MIKSVKYLKENKVIFNLNKKMYVVAKTLN